MVNRPEPFSGFTSQQWPSAWRKGSTHGQEWTRARGNTLSFTPSIACYNTSELFSTRTHCSSEPWGIIPKGWLQPPHLSAPAGQWLQGWDTGWMQQGQFLKQGTRVPYGLEETTSSPQLLWSLQPRVLGTVSCLQSNLRTEGCPVCQRQFSCLSGNKPTDFKAQFHKK